MTRTIDHVDVLRGSEKFRQWHIEPAPEDDPLGCYMMLEKHYAPDELAELWESQRRPSGQSFATNRVC